MSNHGCAANGNVGQAYAQARTALNTGALHGNVLSVYVRGAGGVAPGEMCTRINLPTAGDRLDASLRNGSGSTARFVSSPAWYDHSGESQMTAIKYKENGEWKTLTMPSAVHIGTAAPDEDVKQLWVDTYAVTPPYGYVPPLVSALPTAPFDGQEVRYLSRWRQMVSSGPSAIEQASLSAYKWEFIGGTATVGHSYGRIKARYQRRLSISLLSGRRFHWR